MAKDQKPPKVLLLGLDGATWDLMLPWIEAGQLPNLARLQQQGSWGNLASTLQPVTAPAWVSFMTGMNQGKHNLYDFVRRRAGSYDLELTNASMVQAPTLFDHLSRVGRRVACVNMPFTFPPRPLNGVMVSGLFATVVDESITYPHTFFQTLKQITPQYAINPDYKSQAATPLATYLQDLLNSIDERTKVVEHLLQTEPWDLLAVVYTATDQVQHAFWHCLPDAEVPAAYQSHPQRFGEAILQVYQRIDAAIGRLLTQIDEETIVVVMSDHGAGPLRRWVQLNRWLANEGFLTFKGAAATGQRGRKASLINQAASAYKRLLPDSLRRTIRARLGARFYDLKARMETEMFTATVEWSQTRAYSLGACGNIFINLQGREPQGTVPAAEYETVRSEIATRLATLQDPDTGQPLVRCVHRREDVYSGPYLENAPDLLIEWADYSYWGRGRFDVDSPDVLETRHHWDFSELPLTGTHRPQGIFIIQGTPIQSAAELTGARLIDVLPTILYLMGLPLPSGLDGRVLAEAFTNPPESIPTETTDTLLDQEKYGYSAEDSALIEQRLKELGYL